jgi:hypothetical protein
MAATAPTTTMSRVRPLDRQTVPAHSTPEDFALMRGGPTFSLMMRLRLERHGHPVLNVLAKALLGWLLGWYPLALLSLASGHGHWFVDDLRVQAIFFFSIPALLIGEDYVNGRLAWAAGLPVLLELLPPDALGRYRAALTRAARQRDQAGAELLLLVLAFVITGLKLILGVGIPRFAYDGPHLTPAGVFYIAVGYPLFWFLVLRWAWRFSIWTGVLVRLSRLDLQLVPTHADAAGGLRYLAVCQASFSIVVFAIGVVVSAMGWRVHDLLTQEGLIAYARQQLVYAIAALVVLNLPLLAFCRKMLLAKRRADAQFSALVARHGRAFEKKWFSPGSAPLGNEDMSSEIDITSAYEQASKMRWVPIGLRPLLAELLSGLALPLVPRLLADRQLVEALLKVMPKLVGA